MSVESCSDPTVSLSIYLPLVTPKSQQPAMNVIVFNLSCFRPVARGSPALANLWRTGNDVQTTFASIMTNIKANDAMADVARPGHFNDPGLCTQALPQGIAADALSSADMLQVGNPGLSFNESLTHFALWWVWCCRIAAVVHANLLACRCVASAPLLAGTDVVHASNETLMILTAPELIAINQDLGVDGKLQGKMLKPSTCCVACSHHYAQAGCTGSIGLALATCNGTDSSQQWTFDSNHLVQKSSNGCLQIPDCKEGPTSPGDAAIVADCSAISGSCNGANAQWSLNSNKTITSAMDGHCLDIFEGHGPGVYPHVCNGQTNQQCDLLRGHVTSTC